MTEKSKLDVARAYVDAGLAAQSAGDYDAAITFYAKAYEIEPHPVLLFDIAQAHRLAGHNDQALVWYHKYLDVESEGAVADTAREHVAALEAQSERVRSAQAARRAEDERRADAVRVAAPALAGAASGEGRHPRLWLPLSALGLSAAAAGVSIGFGLRAMRLSDELSTHDRRFDPDKLRRGEQAQTISIVSGAVAGAALIGAGILYWVERSRGERAQVGVVPWLSPAGAGVALGRSL